MVKKSTAATFTEKLAFTADELDQGIAKLQIRIGEIKALADERYDSGRVTAIEGKTRDTIAEIFGHESRKYAEVIDQGEIAPVYMYVNLEDYECQPAFERALSDAVERYQGIVESLQEKRQYLLPKVQAPQPSGVDIWQTMHPAIVQLCKKKFDDNHMADSVETAMKEVNERMKVCYKKRTNKELDGTSLMQTALSPNNPNIVLADQSTQSGRDEQAGYMQIFAGAMQGIRNPKAHANLVIDDRRATHLLFLASLLMYKLDDAGI